MALSVAGGSVIAALVERLVPVLAVVVGALLHWGFTVRAKRDEARVEKAKDIELRIWDLQRVGYSVVLAKLGETSKHAASRDDGFHYPGANPYLFFDSDRYKKLSQKMWAAWADCRSEFEKNRLICSEAFAKRFAEIHQSLTEVDLTGFSPPEEATEEAACFRKAHADLLTIAVAELGLKPEERAGAMPQPSE